MIILLHGLAPLTFSGLKYLDYVCYWGGQIMPAGKIWPLMAPVATKEATKQTNIVPGIIQYL